MNADINSKPDSRASVLASSFVWVMSELETCTGTLCPNIGTVPWKLGTDVCSRMACRRGGSAPDTTFIHNRTSRAGTIPSSLPSSLLLLLLRRASYHIDSHPNCISVSHPNTEWANTNMNNRIDIMQQRKRNFIMTNP